MLGPNGAGKDHHRGDNRGTASRRRAASATVLGMDVSKATRAVKETHRRPAAEPRPLPHPYSSRDDRLPSPNMYRKIGSPPARDNRAGLRCRPSRNVLFKNLSGGQQQRLSVFTGLRQRPGTIIFLDEAHHRLGPPGAAGLCGMSSRTFRRAGKGPWCSPTH